ncbi:hypothetical protein AB0B15_03385 [Streptomyces sp. NPDC045456]|uniref:hypothetical protein n=1 Tax=Streptomyces sp. NPDC045456 TaxID=3155254 RepID=UPI0033DA87A0
MISTILWLLIALLAINAIAAFTAAFMSRHDYQQMQDILDELKKRRDETGQP